jgi:hypothetical protein
LSKQSVSIPTSVIVHSSNPRARRRGVGKNSSDAKNEKTRSCLHDQVSSCAERRGWKRTLQPWCHGAAHADAKKIVATAVGRVDSLPVATHA